MKPSEHPDIDKISEELIQEFMTHKRECRILNPDLKQDRVLFEGWIIQKVASLQHVVLTQNEILNRLSALIAKSL